ncbi:hypothetical protein MMC19_003525 [Ptychographa xylographoides]|nr:hypothetical protein [Ptychographa xylographoides]
MASALASRRLFSEFKALTTDPPDGIIAGPVNEDDIFTWEALIQGPEGTPYEGGVFVAELKFPKKLKEDSDNEHGILIGRIPGEEEDLDEDVGSDVMARKTEGGHASRILKRSS